MAHMEPTAPFVSIAATAVEVHMSSIRAEFVQICRTLYIHGARQSRNADYIVESRYPIESVPYLGTIWLRFQNILFMHPFWRLRTPPLRCYTGKSPGTTALCSICLTVRRTMFVF
jgi:hypothetical protein